MGRARGGKFGKGKGKGKDGKNSGGGKDGKGKGKDAKKREFAIGARRPATS